MKKDTVQIVQQGNNMDLIFEKMTLAHVEEVYRIEELSFFTPWTKQSIRSEVQNPIGTYLVALDGEQIAAYGGFWTIVPEGNINNIAVHPDYRGRGISKILMHRLIELAAQKGVKELYLEVRAGNLVAQNLYKSLGFKMIDIRKGYYADTDEDAIVMLLELKK